MTSNTLCSVLGSTELVPWTLSDDSVFVFLLPDDTAIYARFGESVSVPIGTWVAVYSSITYNNLNVTNYPLAAVGVEITTEPGVFYITRREASASDNTTQVSCPMDTSHGPRVYQINQSCSLRPSLYFEDNQGTKIQIGNSYPTTTVTVTAAGSSVPATIPLQIMAIDFVDQWDSQCIKWVPTGTQYHAYIFVKNDTNTIYTTPINVTINGVQRTVTNNWIPGMSYAIITGLTSTGTDTVCATFTNSTPTNGILDWINAHPIETLAVSAAGILGVSYLATRGILDKAYKRTKK